MPHRRVIIELWGSTEEYAQQEVDRIIRFLKTHEYGESSAFIDPYEYGSEFYDSLHNQAGPGAIGAVLNKDFNYELGRLTDGKSLDGEIDHDRKE